MSVPGKTRSAQAETLALFVSDLHLQAALPRTTLAFIEFLRVQAPRAEQLYLLGDIFEYWAGDDDIEAPYLKPIVEALRALSASGVAVHWIAGNRDFLAGAEFARAAELTQLPDPFVTTIGGHKLVLVHGDAQCTDDAPYMAFRTQVRQADWQCQFLSKPLEERKAIIEAMRAQSRAAQRGKAYETMDVSAKAIHALFESSGASLMIHGHTHRPARHVHAIGGSERTRYVLPDWDCDVVPPRGGWIEIGRDGLVRTVGIDQLAVALFRDFPP